MVRKGLNGITVPDTGMKKPLTKKKPELNQTAPLRCTVCGGEAVKPKDRFFRSTASPLFEATDGYVPICKKCLKKIYTELVEEYKDVVFVINAMCAFMDWPFDAVCAREARDYNLPFPLGEYYKKITTPSFHGMTFATSLKFYFDTPGKTLEGRDELEARWDRESLQNKQYVINMVSYDPFESAALSASDRKFLFNTMAGYCPDSSVATDSHKLQSILNIVQLQLQAQKINDAITSQLAAGAKAKELDDLTGVLKDILQAINSTAKENGVSASGNGGAKAATTLSEKMRLLQDENFTEAEVNLFNIKQAAVMQQVAEISNQAIIRELKFEDHDYSEIISEQREIITKQTQELEELREKVRLLENKEIEKQIAEQRYQKARGEA